MEATAAAVHHGNHDDPRSNEERKFLCDECLPAYGVETSDGGKDGA